MFVIGGVAPVNADVETPVITLERSVHFLTPSDDDVLVETGTYHVEAAEEWLRIIPQGQSRTEGLLLHAEISQLDALLDMPQAVSQQMGDDPTRAHLTHA